MIDYDAARAKVKKLVEKPSDDTTKLPRAQQEHDEAKDIFNLLNDQLIAELPLLVDLRIRKCSPPAANPCFGRSHDLRTFGSRSLFIPALLCDYRIRLTTSLPRPLV
jgi:hypothetical protein